ncbi:hypothetical protein A3Q56_00477 [Intoshia linei]|uniref:Uncharacterized protein n=1 Tax=Intoshia linei TaxID=1819745 RepID=A0A177BC41_9BILA|nr:hypothetical protein A3Q56_00477 [Intoshia linei]
MVIDGASVMVKLGKISGLIHQLCHSHGLHRAVVAVKYKENINNIIHSISDNENIINSDLISDESESNSEI